MQIPPIYSIDAECRDCYKCIRHCPVKAIRVVNDHAVVDPNSCILCGNCVSTCEHGAKRARTDLLKVHHLVAEHKKPIYVSLAPSFVSEFPGVKPAQMFSALKKLGFDGVQETAIGADLVSRRVADLLDNSKGGVYLSTACPVAVSLVQKYYPQLTKNLTPFLPPMMAHAMQLRAEYGNNIDVVFIGPCIGKKRDSDLSNGELTAAMTFRALRRWFQIRNIDPLNEPEDIEYFHPGIGAFYPIEGGMNVTTKKYLKRTDMDDRFLVVSGIEQIQDRMESLLDADFTNEAPIFIEMLACPGGCIAGPASKARSKIASQIDIQKYAKVGASGTSINEAKIEAMFDPTPILHSEFTEDEMKNVMHSIGKYRVEDELNCGGCGYESCRAFAQAMLRGVAEPQMCVSHMRQLAQKKSNALAQSIPFGFAIFDEHLHIQDCNELFSKIFDESIRLAYEAAEGLKGAEIDKIIPAPAMFQRVLTTDVETIRRNVSMYDRIYNVTVFVIDKNALGGVLVAEITESEKRRQQLIEKSREVIKNTTKTVQEIAYMLGKNSAQSELILSSLVDMFKADKVDSSDIE